MFDLPVEVLSLIFGYCDQVTLARACRVCPPWRQLATPYLYSSPMLYTMLGFEHFIQNTRPEVLQQLVKSLSLVSLAQRWRRFDGAALQTVVHHCRGLVRLELDLCALNDHALHALLVEVPPPLITLEYSGDSPPSPPTWVSALPNLRHLSLEKCPIFHRCGRVIRHLTNLESLNVSYTTITDRALIQIIRGCPQLHTLRVAHCDSLSDRPIALAVHQLKYLRVLDIEGCVNVLGAHIDPDRNIRPPDWEDVTSSDGNMTDMEDEDWYMDHFNDAYHPPHFTHMVDIRNLDPEAAELLTQAESPEPDSQADWEDTSDSDNQAEWQSTFEP
ncbi:hypothetical protein BJ085DRAFT_41481 [Dimargaris cristalligena]|uniref:F-box domain-containing protein n=1 Tax=Dimargaris cristalligena TaxID=215637 RepID=A0A4P9ZLH8_9FUNG|nr:hypothetical protein BJ085DRAFT_41481 [Dimargaris cristalligena]|eukprot:RKP33442.1 hypothetical protein BJ085DRAFT_41481 [Dimargaris cristalligena]